MTKRVTTADSYEETISHSGHRLTPQRREVYDVLLAERDHPTATEVFLRAKKQMKGISLATVYNCLETLVECGLVKQVNVEREATRYCPNLQEHGHFVCERCGTVTDVPLTTGARSKKFWQLPDTFIVTHAEITLRGLCPDCNT
ncbi:MAG: Fur family transcriptional regulator [Terrimicrobiaceae bacterium]|jgi:Fur family peroxide stress response transcriptional regulator